MFSFEAIKITVNINIIMLNMLNRIRIIHFFSWTNIKKRYIVTIRILGFYFLFCLKTNETFLFYCRVKLKDQKESQKKILIYFYKTWWHIYYRWVMKFDAFFIASFLLFILITCLFLKFNCTIITRILYWFEKQNA